MIQRRWQSGFSMLELVVVVVLIGLIAATGIKYYIDALDRARATAVEMLAWRFAETVAVVHAWPKIPTAVSRHKHGLDSRGVQWVKLENTRVYLNENGWPANTDRQLSPAISNQTGEECRQLLDALFEPVVEQVGAATKRGNQYEVSVVDKGRSCRYQLAQNREEAWFFEYSLESGRVRASVPQFRIEQNAGN